MTNTKWKKAYKGPFLKYEAENHIFSLKNDVPFKEKLGVLDAKIRLRRKSKKHCVCTAACGAGLGHNKMYDVYIKINSDLFT